MEDNVILTFEFILDLLDARIARTDCDEFMDRNTEARYIKHRIVELFEIYKKNEKSN